MPRKAAISRLAGQRQSPEIARIDPFAGQPYPSLAMSQFANQGPSQVSLADMSQEKRRVTVVSMVATGILAVMKLIVGLMSGSLGVLSGAVDSFMDLAATTVTFFAVRAAERPADDDHPYGHGKYESVAAFVECGFLMAAAGWIALEGVKRLVSGDVHVEPSWLAIGVIIVSIVVDFWRSRALRRTAAATGSHAIEADALNFTGDMVNSGVVLVGLVFVAIGVPVADAIAALFVSVFIAIAAWRLGRRTFDVLVDTAPRGIAERLVSMASRVEGVESVQQVRVRPTGTATFAEVVVSIDRSMPFERVTQVRAEVADAVRAIDPRIEVAVTADPVSLDEETIATRVRILAVNRGLAIHHLTVQKLDGHPSVSFDVELDGDLPLIEAHAVATAFEEEVESDLGPGVEVETHIEPLTLAEFEGIEAPEDRRRGMEEDLARIAVETGGVVRMVHDVRVRETPAGTIVNFHAQIDPSLSVRATHEAMDAVERRFRRTHKDVMRVVSHAEPA